ncbi:T-cell immunomodulatory [Cyclospora cayetanensis]|uniref:T-cell immunomodulatory n=1 Tax=Cyclospora cayetanensis TaxID=88456 RepID=A0A1D3D0E9_9EIME|nr:T-cell immunomodulatory [Cyclospora cayetanensis]
MLRRKRWLVALLLLGALLFVLVVLWLFLQTAQETQQHQQKQLSDASPRGTFTSPWQRDDAAAGDADVSMAAAKEPTSGSSGAGVAEAAALGGRRKAPQGTFFDVALPVPFATPPPHQTKLQQQQQSVLLSLGSRSARFPSFTPVPDYNNDMHVDFIFLGSSAHIPQCRFFRARTHNTTTSTTGTVPPAFADAGTEELPSTEAAPSGSSSESSNPMNKDHSINESSTNGSSHCGSTISVYVWSPESSSFRHQVSVHLKETVDSIVAVDWTQDGRIDIIAVTLPHAGTAAARGSASTVQRVYGLVAFVQRPSATVPEDLLGPGHDDERAGTSTGGTLDKGEDSAASPPVEDSAVDAVGVAAFAFGAGRLHARSDEATAEATTEAAHRATGVFVEGYPSSTAVFEPLSSSAAAVADYITADMTDEELADCGLTGIQPLVADLTFDHFPDLLVQTAPRSVNGSSSHGGKDDGVFRFFWVNLASQGKEGFAPRKWSSASDLFKRAGTTDTPELTDPQQQQQMDNIIPNPHSSAIADIDGDCRADLLLTVQLPGSSSLHIEIWLSRFDGTNAKWKRHTEDIALPPGAGQFVLADFDADGTLDVLVPVCEKNEEGVCIKGDALVMLTNSQPRLCGSFWWTSRTVENCRRPFELCDPNEDFSVAHYDSEKATKSFLDDDSTIHFFGDSAKPPTLSVGDVDGDGFADVALVAVKEGGIRAARIYRNNVTVRYFQLVAEFVATVDGETLHCNRVAFFDFREKGALDLVCQGQPKSPSSASGPFATMRTYMRPVETAADSLFFKATSLNGACPFSFCTRPTLSSLSDVQTTAPTTLNYDRGTNNNIYAVPDSTEGGPKKTAAKPFSLQMVPDMPPPYGAAAVGATFKLTVTDLNGTKTPRVGAQMAQSAHAPLSLPFELFGLGQTNNYVEEFFVGLPLAQLAAYSMWVSLIPNSQVIVMPYPLEKPKSWQLELSVHPSCSFANILITTLVCLLLVALVIFILDRKEKAEDSEQQRGFRSHFIVS